MKLTNSHAIMLLVAFLGCLNLSCGCKKPNSYGGSTDTGEQSSSSGSSNSGSSNSGGSAMVPPPPPPPPTEKKVLVVPTTHISNALYTSAANFIKDNPPVINNTTITFTIENSEASPDGAYDKVMYVTTAITERLEHYFSGPTLGNLNGNRNKYIGIPIQRVATGLAPNSLTAPFLFAPLRAPIGKDSGIDYQTTSQKTIADFIKS